MRHSIILFVGLVCCVLSPALGSYEGAYPAAHDHDEDYYEPSYSYPAPPIVHPHHGHSAGSYYHYHVPLVGQQQQHYQPSYHHQDHSHYLWPLLLLLALPLLFLPLLPLLLLPLGISLLALLAPGGMMMMMMMMMMMGGGMMMRTDTVSGRAFNEMRTFGDVILNDMTSLLSKYARSFDLDQCPQRVACEMGSIFFPENNSTDSSTAKAFSSLVMEQYLPKGKLKKTIKLFEKAFWTGSTRAGSCSAFQCHPTFKIYNKNWDGNGKDHEGDVTGTRGSVQSGSSPSLTSSSTSTTSHFNGSRVEATDFSRPKHTNYVYPSSKVNDNTDSGNNAINSYLSLEEESKQQTANKLKTKRSHYSNHLHGPSYGKHKVEDIHISSAMPYNTRKTTLYKMFGTPTVKS